MKRKKIIIILIIFMICILNMTNVYATSTSTTQSSKIDTGDYEPTDLNSSDYETAFDMASTIVSVITVGGIAISIVSLMYLGIKYMYGSVEERAEYKRTMIPMFIGTILLFSSATIVSIIYNLVKEVK